MSSMGKLIEAVRSLRASVKLAKGRCAECSIILKDDNTTGYCSEAHFIDHLERRV